jgi:4-amino-4-deoxy-L-arabinose transferase-like glycosyltransferase
MRKPLSIALTLAFMALVYVSLCFQPSLLDDADSTHAQAAKEMLQSGDFVTLHINGVRYLEKAPFLYWLVAGSIRIFGVNEFAVRFPTAVAIILLAFMVYVFGRWAFSVKAGAYAAGIIVSCAGVFLFTRVMIPEAWLSCFLLIGHYCFLRALLGVEVDKRYYFGFYAATAMAVLTKGLIGIVFLAGPALIFLLLTGNYSKWREMRILSGALLFAVIAVPWHLLAGLRNEGFFWFYFVNEHFLRFIGKRMPMDYNRVPFLSYWLLHLAWLFPWSFGIPLLAIEVPRSLRSLDRRRLIILYAWLWAGSILIFFSLSTNQEYYTFPAYPPVCLLLGASLASAEERTNWNRYLTWMSGAIAAIALVAAAVLGTLVWLSRSIAATGDLSSWLDKAPADAEQYTLSLGHFSDLTANAFAELRWPAIGAALVLGIGFLVAFRFRKQRQHELATGATVVSMGLLFVCANIAQGYFDPVLSSRVLADEIKRRWEPSSRIVFNGEYPGGSSIGFYTGQPILLLNGRVTGLEFGSRYPDAPPVFLEKQDLMRLWKSADRIFLFTEDSKKESLLNMMGSPVFVAAQRGGKSLLMNKP